MTNRKHNEVRNSPASAVDLFCGAGGLTRGLLDAGIPVAAGYDIDEACRYPYEHNNTPAVFKKESVADLTGVELATHYPDGHVRILVGCAPCQPFSKYTQGLDTKSDKKWGLLHEFARLVRELQPEIVSMENVPELQRHSVFDDFLATLTDHERLRIVRYTAENFDLDRMRRLPRPRASPRGAADQDGTAGVGSLRGEV